jgi:hypothetical protein
VIWEPFVLALVLGIIISAGLYFAYLWPAVEPLDEEPAANAAAGPADSSEPDDSGVSDAPPPPSTANPSALSTTAEPPAPPADAASTP